MILINRHGWKMSEQQTIHATLVALQNKGVLLKGKSSSGKSDLALRLIQNKKATLVADDIVIITKESTSVTGRAPQNLQGLLEVRGIGIVRLPFLAEISIDLIVNLQDNEKSVERMPKDAYENIFGVEIKQIDLYAKENSAPEKIQIKLFGTLISDKPLS